MVSDAPSQRFPVLDRPVMLIAVVGMVIAVIAPFDVAFEALTAGSQLLRPLLIAILVIVGSACARRSGMKLEGHGAARPSLIGLAAAAAVALYVVVIDAWFYRTSLPDSYVQFMHAPLFARLSYYMLRAFNENILYRLFLFSGLVWLVTALLGGRKPPGAMVIVLMILAQLINVGITLGATHEVPTTALLLSYDLCRYIVPGVVWAVLFWRFGFATAEVASVGCHLFLQPALGGLI